jgi:hypothetical protein
MNRYTLSAAFGIAIGFAAAFVVAGGGNGRPVLAMKPVGGVVRADLRHDVGGYNPVPPLPKLQIQHATSVGNAMPVPTGHHDHLGRPILFGHEHLAR